jgi:hypothetical protein
VLIDLDGQPTREQAAALEQVLRAWASEGEYPSGSLHGWYQGSEFGARWTGATLKWLQDFGSAEAEAAAADLAGRLGAWAVDQGVGIRRLRFGT